MFQKLLEARAVTRRQFAFEYAYTYVLVLKDAALFYCCYFSNLAHCAIAEIQLIDDLWLLLRVCSSSQRQPSREIIRDAYLYVLSIIATARKNLALV